MSLHPSVACVMLARDRPEMSRRAVDCFRNQSYPAAFRMLVILDSGDPSWYQPNGADNEVHLDAESHRGKPIGALRNIAIECVSADVIAHWDSDDWYHPDHLWEMISLLSRTDDVHLVGYNSALFWDTAARTSWRFESPNPAFVIGASMVYRRATWEKRRFRDLNIGEDLEFWTGRRAAAVSSILHEPRMVCSLHAGNTSSRVEPGVVEWSPASSWDGHLSKLMEMKTE